MLQQQRTVAVAAALLFSVFLCVMLIGPYYQARVHRTQTYVDFLRSGYCDNEILRHLQRVSPDKADIYAGVHIHSASYRDIKDTNCANAITYAKSSACAGAVSDALQDLNLYKSYDMLLNADTWESHAAIWFGWAAVCVGVICCMYISAKTFVQVWWAGSLTSMLDRKGHETPNTIRMGGKRIAVVPIGD